MLIKTGKKNREMIEDLRNTKPMNITIGDLHDVHSNSHVYIHSESFQYNFHYVNSHYTTLIYNGYDQQVIDIHHPTKSFRIVDPIVIKDENSKMVAVISKVGYVVTSNRSKTNNSFKPILNTFFIFNSRNGIDSYPNGERNVFTKYIKEYIQNNLNETKVILKETPKTKYKYKYQSNRDDITEMRKKRIKNTINNKYDIESNQPVYIIEYDKNNKCKGRHHHITSHYIKSDKDSLGQQTITVYHSNRSFKIVKPIIILNRATGMIGVTGSKVYVSGDDMFKNSSGRLIGNLTHFIINFEMPLETIEGLTYDFSNFIETYKNNINKIEKEVTTNGK